MALIQCPECKKEISSLAEACPSCGFPITRGFFSKAGVQLTAVSTALIPVVAEAKRGLWPVAKSIVQILFNIILIPFLIFVIVVLFVVFGVGIAKGPDVAYGGAYIVYHCTDVQAVPLGAQLCKKMFCRRADTAKGHLAGRPGYTSEEFGYFCRDHWPSDNPSFFSWIFDEKGGGRLWSLACCLTLVTTMVIWGLITFMVGALIASPVLILGSLHRRKPIIDSIVIGAKISGVILGITSSFLYLWF